MWIVKDKNWIYIAEKNLEEFLNSYWKDNLETPIVTPKIKKSRRKSKKQATPVE